jgi:hypothetical protein
MSLTDEQHKALAKAICCPQKCECHPQGCSLGMDMPPEQMPVEELIKIVWEYRREARIIPSCQCGHLTGGRPAKMRE